MTGMKIRALLAEKKISVTELARRIGVKQPTLSEMLRGDMKGSTLERIAAALNVPVSRLMEDETAPPDPPMIQPDAVREQIERIASNCLQLTSEERQYILHTIQQLKKLRKAIAEDAPPVAPKVAATRKRSRGDRA